MKLAVIIPIGKKYDLQLVRNGLLVEETDVTGLTATIYKLAGGPELRETLERQYQGLMRQEFS